MCKSSMYRAIACLCVLFLVFAMTGCGREEAPTVTGVYESEDRVTLSEEEVMAYATHIVKAEYLGAEVSEYRTKLRFAPKEAIKGKLDAEEDKVIYVEPRIGEAASKIAYTVGEQYLLFLEKHIIVYDEYPTYVQLGELLISSQDSQWEAYCKAAVDIAEKTGAKTPDSYGYEFTDSEDLNDIISFAGRIFLVSVDSVFVESTDRPTTVYRCKVRKTVKKQPARDGDILITFFNGTVEMGKEYLVFLADTRETATLYALAAKDGCVYDIDTAKSIPQLAALLEQAEDYSAGQSKTDAEMLEEERQG